MRRWQLLLGLIVMMHAACPSGAGAKQSDPAIWSQETIPYTCEVVRAGDYAFCAEIDLPSDMGLSLAQSSPKRTCRHLLEWTYSNLGGGTTWRRLNPSDGTIGLHGNRNGVNGSHLHLVHCGPEYTGTVTGSYLIERTSLDHLPWI